MSAGCPLYPLHDPPTGKRTRQVDGLATQDDDPLVTVGPCLECQDCLEVFRPDGNRVHGCDELVVPMRFAATAGSQSRSPFCRAMNPSTLVPTKTDPFIVLSWFFVRRAHRG